jgi:hypothetical protein
MDQVGRYFLVGKHLVVARGKKRIKRFFFTEDNFEVQRELAKKYSEKNKEDYLIVKVIEEIRLES